MSAVPRCWRGLTVAPPLLVIARVPTDAGPMVLFRHRNKCATRFRGLLASADDAGVIRILRSEHIAVPEGAEAEVAAWFRSSPVESAVTPITCPNFRNRQ